VTGRRRAIQALLAVLVAGAAVDCEKGAAPAAPGSAVGATTMVRDGAAAVDDDAGEPMESREADAWARAQDGGDDEDIRLADLVGCEGLRERAGAARLRRTAVRAMAYCRDFSQLPWLAEIGAHGADVDAIAALDAIVEQAARVRRATDPDDADELHAGCAALLALGREAAQPRSRRVRAIRALRMLSDRGCVARKDIPVDLDPK
jgi:hypothetical protein